MTEQTDSTHVEPGTIEERIRELEEIEDELRLVANSECGYSKYAQNFLDALEEVRQ
jgi:hypothetical protein